jgi:hypothetical protein
MTDAELAKCFFPSVRKELIIEAVSLLQNRAGEQRIKVGLVMPLSDGKLVGMPSWVGDGFDHIGKEDTLETAIKYALDLKEMSMFIHSTEDTPKPTHTIFNVMLTAFSLRRDPQDESEEELPDVALHFAAYVPDSTPFWAWLQKHFRKSIFVRFETTQQELPLSQPAPDNQMKLGSDDYEAQRKEAT